MMKLTKRKGFNFFRSYFDVYNELDNDEDKVAFMDALLERQFMGVKPTELKGMAKFAYISQTNSIDSQVKGYEDKTKTKLNPLENVIITPTEPPAYGGKVTPTLQVEEKVEEEVEESITIEEEIFKKASSKYKMYSEQLYKDKVFIEALSRNQIKDPNKDVCKNTIHKYLKLFLSHLDEYKHVHDNKKQFSANFSNWLRKQKIVKVYPEQEKIRYS
jgi:hypothetical protein